VELKNKKIGFVLTGSFYALKNTIIQIKNIVKKGAEVIPIMSYNAYTLDSKFGKSSEYINEIENITKKNIICSIQDAGSIGPKQRTDIMIVAPATR